MVPIRPPLNDALVLVEPARLDEFDKRLKRLNRKAETFGLAPIGVHQRPDMLYAIFHEFTRNGDIRTTLRPARPGEVPELPYLFKCFEIQYPIIKLGNWRVVGKIEAVEGGNLTFCVSETAADRDEIVRRAAHPIECEHCHLHRRRKDAFLLRDLEQGGYKVVGRQCLEDFTGIDPAAALFLAELNRFTHVSEGDEFDVDDKFTPNCTDTAGFLTQVSFLVEFEGFISAKRAREQGLTATWEVARPDAFWRHIDQARLMAEFRDHHDQHAERAASIRAWVAAMPPDNDYARNVKLLLAQDTISLDHRHLALVASTVPMYQRAMTLAADRALDAHSRHVGEVGEKRKAVLTICAIHDFETLYGPACFVKMRDVEGNTLKWRTSSLPYDLRHGVGRPFEAAFRIKEHGEYEGTAETAVKNVKWQRWLDEDLDAAPEEESAQADTEECAP